MHNVQAMMLGVFLGTAAFTTGCGGGTIDGGAVGSSQARIVLSSKGSNAATLHVTATDDATSAVVLDKTVEVQGNTATVLDLSLPPASYTFAAGVLGGASGNATLGSDSADVHLTLGTMTQITVATAVASGNTSAQVQIGVDLAPTIHGIDVQLTGGQSQNAAVQIAVDAADADGGSLSFFWSGAGLQGAVQGNSSLSIPLSAIAGAAGSTTQPVVHVIVQDAQGATTEADIALTIADGAVQSTTSTATSASAAAAACLDTQAQCNAGCSSGLGIGGGVVSADASCLAQCTLALASCQAP